MKRKIIVIIMVCTLFLMGTYSIDPGSYTLHSSVSSQPYSDFARNPNASYPSYLFLNNWINSTIWVYTGICDPYIPVSGSPSISDISLGTNISNSRLTVNSGNESVYSTLLQNNSIIMKQKEAEEYVVFTPYSDQFLISQLSRTSFKDSFNFSKGTTYVLTGNTIIIETSPKLYVYHSASSISAFNTTATCSLNLSFPAGYSYVEVAVGYEAFNSTSSLISANNNTVEKWLRSSRSTDLPGPLYQEYNTSLLIVKDDQDPYDGEFLASPSPLYLYAWVRDGSFSAISMIESGHYNTALKYFKWMASEQGNECVSGAWQTRFNLWTGAPALSWVHPEYDSVGTFQMGIYFLYQYTHNSSLIYPFLENLNRSLVWEEDNISSVWLLPQDYSIWEDQYAYNFWTQAIDDVGMNDTIHLYQDLHLKTSGLALNQSKLTMNILKYYTVRDGTMFAEFDTSAIGDPQMPFAPYDLYDSSTILPIALGLIDPNSSLANDVVSHTVANLTVNGGLARFFGDTYHYSGYPSDSSGPMPPWIITTMFEAYYDEVTGNDSGALGLMYWAHDHSQSGLLPEAIDPNYGNPLPTTSPLTWSSAMFIIVSVHYHKEVSSSNSSYYYLGLGAAVVIAAVGYTVMVYRKRSGGKMPGGK